MRWSEWPKSFNILYTNARSVVNKIDELITHVNERKPHFVFICEAWTHSEITDALLQIDGYSLEARVDRKDTLCGKGGGLLIYAKVGTKTFRINSAVLDSFNQCCGLKLPWYHCGDLTLILAYRQALRAKC